MQTFCHLRLNLWIKKRKNNLVFYLKHDAQVELDGEHLNQAYGLIGAEQHLPRYPGDSASDHGAFLRSGITPGLGAWRYFADSKGKMTEDLVQKEKYYVA